MKRKYEKITIAPRQLIVLLRNPDCDCCPFFDECSYCENEEEENCILFAKAADCIDTLLKKGN